MKLQKLTIHNIASIEDAVIDFEAHPLADSEVFLITGKTGAGKSTILDAICLALYADTPRLDNTKMQGDTKDGTQEIKVNDPRQLMRRNTGEAFVSLTFVGSNSIHYEASWSIARAHRKTTGNIQKKDWKLKNLDTRQTLCKDKEIEAEIKAAIGLDFNQFCRTTMLAQGEFTRFLNSKDDEKAEILEKITGVDIYSKIGAKVYAITSQKQETWKEALRLVEGTRTLPTEEIESKRETLAAIDKQQAELKAASEKETAKLDWIRTDKELSKGIEEAASTLKATTEAIESEEFRQKDQLIKDWNTTIDARIWMTEVLNASREQAIQQQVIANLGNEYSVLLGGLKFNEQEVDEMSSEVKKTDSFLFAEADKATVYENAQTIAGYLTTIADGRKHISKSRNDAAMEIRNLTEILTPTFLAAKDKETAAKEAFTREENEVKAKEEEVAVLNLQQTRCLRDNAKDLLAKIATAYERIDALTSAKEKKKAAQKELTERLASINEKKKTSAEKDSPIQFAKLNMDIRKENLDKQSESLNKFASTLRTKLHMGDTCPVCRQKIETEIPHEEELALLISGLTEDYEKAEKEYKDLCDEKMRIEAEIRTEMNVYERDIKAFEQDDSVSIAEQKAQTACFESGISIWDDSTLPALNDLQVSTKTKLEGFVKKINEGEEIEKEVKRRRSILEEKRKEVELLAEKALEAERAVNNCKGKISTTEAILQTKEKEVEYAATMVQELISSGTWEIDWQSSPKEFAEALITAARTYNACQQKRLSLLNRLETLKTNVANISNAIAGILTIMPVWENTQPTAIAKTDNLLADVNALNTSLATALAQLKSAEEKAETNKEKLNRFLTEHEDIDIDRLAMLNKYTPYDIASENETLKKDRDTVIAKKTLLEKAKELRNNHLQKKPQIKEEEETPDSLMALIADYERQLTEIGEKKGAICLELKIDKEEKERLGTLIEDAEKKEAEYNKWSRMNQLIGDATGSRFRKIAQSYILSSLIHSANSYMQTLTDRYSLRVTPGTFVISLEDAYQGFVSRAASTISGGESFLVSLSLALALSDIGQTLSVDTLFIDEGFGTLSGEPLQNAINTLRSLHTKAGRHVGIISHVEELQERIPVQIQVVQEGHNSSSKVIVTSSNC